MLNDHFSGHAAFKSIITNGGLNFFPVSSLQGTMDPSVVDLMAAIEKEIESSDYVHEEKPVSWLQAYDSLKSMKKPLYLYTEVVDVCKVFDIKTDNEIKDLLSFFHDLGMLMWHEEASLRDIVIMDPIAFLVKPATKIICQHETTVIDGVERSHYRDIHGEMSSKYFDEYKALKSKGLVSERLMLSLLTECGETIEKRHAIVNLLVKYGLIARLADTTITATTATTTSAGFDTNAAGGAGIVAGGSYIATNDLFSLSYSYNSNQGISEYSHLGHSGSLGLGLGLGEGLVVDDGVVGCGTMNGSGSGSNSSRYSYLVPAFLPFIPISQTRLQPKSRTGGTGSNTFYFLFSTSNFLKFRKGILWKEIEAFGFLPKGFFERLICRCISWSQVLYRY